MAIDKWVRFDSTSNSPLLQKCGTRIKLLLSRSSSLQVSKREILTDRSIPASRADAGVRGAVGVVIVQFQTVVVVIE